ncbi:MAG TPA: hypothetical protein VEC99_08090, partial [Clostridia bacterium]|nr:hypothetical protein [Clostridia bacterium]
MKTFPRFLLSGVAFVSLLTFGFASEVVVFTNDTLISPSNTNYDHQEIVVSNCVVTIDGLHSFASLQILKGGTVTHSASTNGVLGTRLSIAGEQQVMSSTNGATVSHTNV